MQISNPLLLQGLLSNSSGTNIHSCSHFVDEGKYLVRINTVMGFHRNHVNMDFK